MKVEENGSDGKYERDDSRAEHSSHKSHSSHDPVRIIPPRGDYHTLLAFQKSEVVYDITFRFAHKYLSRGDRTVDQMIQAARSGKKNLLEGSKELAKLAEKSDLKEAEAKRLSHNVRIDSNRQRVDDFNASRIAIKTTKDALDPRIEASNVRLKKFQNSVEEHNYGVEDWKAECANRPYAEADEVIIKKEMGN